MNPAPKFARLAPLVLAPFALAQAPVAFAQAADDWPRWRGPSGTGVATGSAPTRWSDEENVSWRVAVPGRGVSTPILLGERLFLSTAVPRPSDDLVQDSFGGSALEPQSFELHCLDARSGATRWRAVACVATPHEAFHKSYGSYASASPVTDGERVYVSFGSQGVHAFDLEGTPIWSFDPGVKLAMRNAFGEGLAPVLADGVLVQVADQESGSFVFALDTATGKELWRVPRDEPSAWATPLVTTFDGTLQVVTSGVRRTRSYDVSTGTLLWEGAGAGLNAIPAVLRHAGLVLVMSGYKEAKILALEPGVGAQDGGEGTGPTVRWTSTKGCGYTASPVLHEGLYYTVTDGGLLSCFDAATGEAHYLEQRLPRGSTLKASPIAAGESLYLATEAGEVHLLPLGPEFAVAATNTLADQVFIASPAVTHGALYLRSLTHLIRVSDGS